MCRLGKRYIIITFLTSAPDIYPCLSSQFTGYGLESHLSFLSLEQHWQVLYIYTRGLIPKPSRTPRLILMQRLALSIYRHKLPSKSSPQHIPSFI